MGCCQSGRNPTVQQALNAQNKENAGNINVTTTTVTATTTTATTTTTVVDANNNKTVKVETAANEKLEVERKDYEVKTEPSYDRMDNRISVHVLQGRNLLAADAGGNSDPYVKVTFVNKADANKPLEQLRTRVVLENRLNPVWNDTVICEGVGIISACEAIRLDVWDYDATSKDDFLGTVTLTDIPNYRGLSLPVWLALKDKKGGPAGEIQVQVSIVDDCNTLIVRDWTHVLELTIGKGIELEKMAWFKKDAKPYVRLEWGTQALHTSKLANITNSEWNEKAFLFVHEEKNSKHVLQITVMDDNIKDAIFGQGVLSARKVFEHKGKDIFEKKVPLTKIQIEFDKALSLRALEEQENAHPECGTLVISGKLHLREDIQTRYYAAMVDYFDEDKDGNLDKAEIQKFLLTLDIPEDPEMFFRKYDEDANGTCSKEEIINMLKDYDFQRSPWMALALEKFLKPTQKGKSQNGAGIFDGHLMSGVTEPPRIGNERQIIKVQDRHTGLVIQENIPGYVWQALQLMYNSTTGRVFATQMSSMLTKMSRDKGREYDNPVSAIEIPHFVELHNLDMNIMLKKKIDEYETFNDFFARAIDPDARPLHSPANEDVVLSPADCRLMAFPNIVESSIWVKGSQWTIGNLLGTRYEAVGKKLEGGSFVIARLAPQDYHRFHWPVSGKVTKITPINGALYTVNPIAINQPINVYTENKRCVIEIDTGEEQFGTVVVVPIGATMVGSYLLFEKDGIPLEEGAEVRRGEVCGEFRFGGSTVLLLFEKNRIVLDEDLVHYSREKLETLIQVRDRIGQKVVKS